MVNVGIDLHKTQFTVCVRGYGLKKGTDGFSQYPTTPGGYEAFLKEMSKLQKKGEEVRVGVESTGNTRHFKSRMEEAGIGVTVINTLKMKVVTESVKKTDKHDAATIAEFLEKDMLPESRLCSPKSEQLRCLLKTRDALVKAEVKIKNQIHAILTSEGMEDVKGSLQSKIGRKRVLDALNQCNNGLVAQPLFEIIDSLEKNIKGVEQELRCMTADDRVVELLMSIPGCGEIGAWTIRAWTDDIKRFDNEKKYCSYAGLVPWVQNSNESVRHGRITKRGPEKLRTALVQLVMGMRRMKAKLVDWRLMERYEAMKKAKGSGKAIIAAARKLAVIIWHMLTEDAEFDVAKMLDKKLARKSEQMGGLRLVEQALINEPKKQTVTRKENKEKKKAGVASKKSRKVG